jgi:hypothetical protein
MPANTGGASSIPTRRAATWGLALGGAVLLALAGCRPQGAQVPAPGGETSFDPAAFPPLGPAKALPEDRGVVVHE